MRYCPERATGGVVHVACVGDVRVHGMRVTTPGEVAVVSLPSSTPVSKNTPEKVSTVEPVGGPSKGYRELGDTEAVG